MSAVIWLSAQLSGYLRSYLVICAVICGAQCIWKYRLASGAPVKSIFVSLLYRVVLDSWLVSQIWIDSDSNESSQSWVGRENEEYESSQSRISLIVIWARVESTGYCLRQSWVTDFSEDKTLALTLPKFLHSFVASKGERTNIQLHLAAAPSPRSTTFGKIRWNVMSRESDLTQLWLKWVESELSQVSKFGIRVESEWLNSDSNELSRSWVRLVKLH